jgi:hypothetical protein
MGPLASKILVGYPMAGAFLSIPLAYKSILNSKTQQSTTIMGFIGRAFLFLLLMMVFWPLLTPILLGDEYRTTKMVLRTVYDHYWYCRTSDVAKIRRLLEVYNVFKRYRAQARNEKLLKATAHLYFQVMRWRESQTRDALKIIEPRIGTEVVNLKDLAKAILILKKPCLDNLGCPSDFDYEGEFKAPGKKDKTIELVLSDSSAEDAEAW